MQILLNLLSNAVKYNRPNGSVTVGCVRTAEGRYRVSVSDTGFGIPPEKLKLLFLPFERLGAERTGVEGTGLGLSLSRALAEAMNGSLGVETVVDQGSSFWVELPESICAPLPPPPFVSKSSDAEVRHDSRGVVLYIEDNVSNVRLMQRVLERRPGITLLHAGDGARGVAFARDHRPSLILLDMHLPDGSGEGVLRQLWEDPSTRPIPVVVLTADASPGLVRRLKAAGAIDCFTKPLDIRQVLDAIDANLRA